MHREMNLYLFFKKFFNFFYIKNTFLKQLLERIMHYARGEKHVYQRFFKQRRAILEIYGSKPKTEHAPMCNFTKTSLYVCLGQR